MSENMQSVSILELQNSARTLTLPVSIDLQLNESAVAERIELLRFFRILPGKRVVALARWRDRLVVAKIFLVQSSWKRHLLRETNGITFLLSEGISTPKIEGIGNSHGGEAGVLLLEYMDQSKSVRKGWKNSDDSEREQLLTKVVGLIARCHSRGLVQHDIHLDNFLLQQLSSLEKQKQQLYLLDAADVERRASDKDGVALDNISALQNLALFFAQFPASNDHRVAHLFEHYRRQRPDARLDTTIASFKAMLRRARLRRIELVSNKLYRTSTANVCVKTWTKFVVYRRKIESPSLQAFIDDPDAVMEKGKSLKQGNSSTVALVEIDGNSYVVKRYNLKSPWHFLRRMWRPSRAWVSWRNAHTLKLLGIATPAPRLMMERRIGFLRGQAYFVSKFNNGEDVLSAVSEQSTNSKLWQRMLAQFEELFCIMREYGIVHGDTKASNFILGKTRLKVLDLDAMQMGRSGRRFRRGFQKDLQRFADNWHSEAQKFQQASELISRL